MSIGPMVPLTTAANPLAARILAAHLGAEGIVWQLRGNVDGPYPIGPVEVLVPADDLELARAVVASSDADPVAVADDEPDTEMSSGTDVEVADRRGRPLRMLLLVVGLLLVVLFALGRVLFLGN